MKNGRQNKTEQNNVPATTEYRSHTIVFSVCAGQKHVAVYRGVVLPSYKVLEHTFSVSDWDGVQAWAEDGIDDLWSWYIERVDDERDRWYGDEE